MTALRMADPNELSSLEIKLLHFLSAGPQSITQICKKLQIVRDHAEKLAKNLVAKRFVTKQSNGQYRNFIKPADIPAIPNQKLDEEPAAPLAQLEDFKPEPPASCTHPICTCPKDQCEEDPLVSRMLALTESVKAEADAAEQFSNELARLVDLHIPEKSRSLLNAPEASKALPSVDAKPFDSALQQELAVIAQQLEMPPMLSVVNIDKKLGFISHLRLLLDKLPHTSSLLDEMQADYMELKRQQETA